MQQLVLESDFIKLESALKAAGWCETGGQAKLRIQRGEVTLNGAVCLQRGKKCRAGDIVRMDGQALSLLGAEAPRP